MPSRAMDVTCNAIVMPLLTVKKALLVAEKTATRANRLPSAANFWMMSFWRSLTAKLFLGSAILAMSFLTARPGRNRTHTA
ncbi:hypothetical protein D3C72_1386170 [compost metagenome]